MLWLYTYRWLWIFYQTLQTRTAPVQIHSISTVLGCCDAKVTQETTQYVCAADRDSRCVVERKLLYYCMIERGRGKEIARERWEWILPEGENAERLPQFYWERKRERKVLVWLQSEMSSVKAPTPEGTNLTVCAFVSLSVYECVCLCFCVRRHCFVKPL